MCRHIELRSVRHSVIIISHSPKSDLVPDILIDETNTAALPADCPPSASSDMDVLASSAKPRLFFP
jgi:hypothetical protein